MKKFWNWKNQTQTNQETQETVTTRTLFLNGTIAEESWFDDDITPALFKEELLSGSGDITVWINSPGGDCVAAAQIYNMLMWTYIVDDDIVINGWYFLNGEPKLYVRDTPDASYASWGRNQMARYKTYALREWIFRSNVYNLYRELFLITPYLATINNLGTPVIKTADKTMKITYTITEE